LGDILDSNYNMTFSKAKMQDSKKDQWLLGIREKGGAKAAQRTLRQ
jgi:hypothetical protein